MRTDLAKRDITKYCDFHRDHRHWKDDCIQLKKEIEFLIRRGHLRRYVAPEDRNSAPPPPPRQPAPTQHQQPLGEINVISGGFADGGESSSARKAHLRSFRSGKTLEVQAVSKLPRLDTTITFSNADLEGCQHPYDDPLVIRAVVANKTVHRVLIDNGSSTDIIFALAFDKMGIGREKLEPIQLDDQPEHLAYIGSKLAEDVRDLLIHFLKQNVEVFAWKQEGMGGIDPAVITHKLNVSPSFKPVKQKRRSLLTLIEPAQKTAFPYLRSIS